MIFKKHVIFKKKLPLLFVGAHKFNIVKVINSITILFSFDFT